MAKAFKAPISTYQRKRFVSQHAIDRLRERLIVNNVTSRGDHDLANWIDRAVDDAVHVGAVERFVEHNGELLHTARLDMTEYGHTSEEPMYALIKSNNRRKHDESIVTLIDREKHERYRTMKWRPAGAAPAVQAGTPSYSVADARVLAQSPRLDRQTQAALLWLCDRIEELEGGIS